MKRLKGGLILLSVIGALSIDDTEHDITDTELLDELDELKTFIDENRDYSKAGKGVKPVVIEYRDNSSDIEGVAIGTMSFNTDALHLTIGASSQLSDGTALNILINVVYEWVDYEGYKVASATIKSSLDDKLIYNPTTNTVEIGTNLYVDGKIKDISKIVDEDGRNRFVEFEPEVTTNLKNANIIYNKCVLSGNILSFVVCGNFGADISSVSIDDLVIKCTLPEWIINKITPLIVGTSSVAINRFTGRYNNFAFSDMNFGLGINKDLKYISIYSDAKTLSEESQYNFRIQFDLLID